MTRMQSILDTIARVEAWGEKILRINVRGFLKGFSWLMAGQVVGILTALLLAVGYSHFLPKEIYGTYKYVLSIFAILTAFSLPGMSDAAQKAIAQGKEGVFWKTLRKRIEWSAVGALISGGIGVYYLFNGNVSLGTVFLAATPFLVFIDAFTQFNALLMGRQLFQAVTLYSMGIQIGASLIIFGTVLYTQNLVILIVGYLLAFVLLRGLTLYHVVTTLPPNGTLDETAMRYGAHMSANNILNFIVGQMDSILLWHFLGPISLAIYAFAEAAADQAQKAFKLITTAMAFPKFSATDKEVLKKTLPRKILIAHAFTTPPAIVLALIIPFVYRVLFPQYIASIPYAQVMAVLLAMTPLRMLATAIGAKGSIRAIYALSIAGSTLQMLLLLIMIPFWGIWGAIYATLIQQILNNAFAFYLFKKM